MIITMRNAVNYKSSDALLHRVIENPVVDDLRTFPQRLRWARERAKLTQPQLARLCGWESQSRISHYERGRRQPVPEDLKLISSALRRCGVAAAPAWLQWGEGPIPFEEMPSGMTLGEFAKTYGMEVSPEVPHMVPLISWVRAGEFAEVQETYAPSEAEEFYPYPKRASESVVALRVEGDSMTAPFGKSYPDGSVIFVNLDQRTPVSGQRVVAKLEHDDKATFKVFVSESGKRWLRPLNPQYPPIYDPFRVVGIVVGKWEDE